MTAHALISGVLVRAPERRVAKSGKSFVAATIATADRDEKQWWSISAFADDVCAELLRLDAGDAVSVQGPLTLSVYVPDSSGAPRVNARLLADTSAAGEKAAGEGGVSLGMAGLEHFHDSRP